MTLPRLSIRTDLPTVLPVEQSKVVRLAAGYAGEVVEPEAGGTFTLVGRDGSTLHTAAVTVTNGAAQVTIPDSVVTDNLTRGGGYQERWSLDYPGYDHPIPIRREAAVAPHDLYPTVTDDDLDRVYPDLRRITGPGTKFPSWQPMIDAAWETIIRELIEEGIPSYGILSPTALKTAHLELAQHLRFNALMGAQGIESRWEHLAGLHWERYGSARKRLTWASDADLDGMPDDDERTGRPGVIHVNVSPRRRLSRGRGW